LKLYPSSFFNAFETSAVERLLADYNLPLHIYFTARFRCNTEKFQSVLARHYPRSQICFAVKANPCIGAIRVAQAAGLGVDVVSQYELRAALKTQIPGWQIICNGNAKTNDYIDLAVKSGACIAADSESELKLIDESAGRQNRKAQVLLRVAGMPLAGLTSADQSTASEWTKFGIPASQISSIFDRVRAMRNIEILGLSAHIGTQICRPAGYEHLLEHLLAQLSDLIKNGMNLRVLDIGGGYPLNYLSEAEWTRFKSRLRLQLAGRLPTAEWVTWNGLPMGYEHLKNPQIEETSDWLGKAYWSPQPGAAILEHILTYVLSDGTMVKERLKQLGEPLLIVEPGRALIGSTGITLARAIGVKEVLGCPVVILDLGVVNHGTVLISPDIYPVEVYPPKPNDAAIEAFIAGRLCFTGDMLSKVKIPLNRLPARGEVVILHQTGAYCADHFASNSCGFPRPAKIAIDEHNAIEIWRKAETFEDVFN